MTQLRLTRRIEAPREQVYRAWTEPEELKRWWGPGEFTVPRAEVDLRPGGAYRFWLRSPAGETLVLAGRYETVEPPERLVFTWSWQSGWDDPAVTRVSLELRELDAAATELVLVHELVDGGAVEMHRMGWETSLDKLEGRPPRASGHAH